MRLKGNQKMTEKYSRNKRLKAGTSTEVAIGKSSEETLSSDPAMPKKRFLNI